MCIGRQLRSQEVILLKLDENSDCYNLVNIIDLFIETFKEIIDINQKIIIYCDSIEYNNWGLFSCRVALLKYDFLCTESLTSWD